MKRYVLHYATVGVVTGALVFTILSILPVGASEGLKLALVGCCGLLGAVTARKVAPPN